MAIIIADHTICSVCGQVIREGDGVVAFPAFVVNRADPLYRFSDAALHARCAAGDDAVARALRALEQFAAATAPDARVCAACGSTIVDPDDYLCLGLISSDARSPLAQWNFLTIHLSCVRQWPKYDEFMNRLRESRATGGWTGPAPDWLIRTLEKAAGVSS